MKLARVTGTVEATVKDSSLIGKPLLLVDLIDGVGAVAVPAFVAVDACGAGVGDRVLVTFNDAARMPAAAAGAATDATIVAIVDAVTMSNADAGAAPETPRRRPAKRSK